MIFDEILLSFAGTFLSFLQRIHKALLFFNRSINLKTTVSGYVLILVMALIPVLLLGTKYVLDQRTADKATLEKNSEEYYKNPSDYYKNCAREVALEVAKKWNPGLTFYQQREAMYKVADDEYNKRPTYSYSTPIYTAVPGMDLPTRTVTKGGSYIPLKVNYSNYQNLDPSLRTVEYTEETNNWVRASGAAVDNKLACRIFSMFNTIYNFDNRDSALVLEDTIKRYSVSFSTSGTYANQSLTKAVTRSTNRSRINSSGLPYCGFSSSGVIDTDTSSPKVYRRKTPDDDKVKIEVINDQIKVTTDGNYVGYAVPASCNVDIVLGIPVNGAASNKNNRDSNSSTAGSPYTASSNTPTTDGLSTPISQIGRTFHDFVQKFYYTRGVNVGIVPYCGMVSLPLDRIETWAVDPDNFNRTVFPANQNTYQGYIRPCMLYGLFGNYGVDPGMFISHYGIDTFSFTNVMVPQGKIEAVERYGNNLIYCGDILSDKDPAGDIETKDGYLYSPKFMRRPVYKIPGFAGKFNFLSMNFATSGEGWTWCNPYHIVEMQSDLLKITDLLNLFYPFDFASNGLSNFIFVPFVWANNLFRDWSKDPKHDPEDTTDAKLSTMTNETSGRLSTPSKTTEGRKKALILVVNKPDWFEPGELTYLGYDNDFSELPMIESDCIRGDIDYTDTTKYFADGTAYDGTIAGAKKIIKLTGDFARNSTTGYYECASGSATLTFPQKYLVKLVVEGKVTWKSAGKKYNPTANLGWGNISWDGTKFLTGTSSDGVVLTSTDGMNWTATSTNPAVNSSARPAYGNGKWFYMASATKNPSYTSGDGINWPYNVSNSWYCDVLSYGNGVFMCISPKNGIVWITENPNTIAVYKPNNSPGFGSIEVNYNRALGFCNGKWCAITWSGKFIVSYDNGATWTVESLSGSSPGDVTGTRAEWYGPVYGFGRYWAICRGDGAGATSNGEGNSNTTNNSRIVFSRDGKYWYKADAALGTICGTNYWFRGLGFNGTRFVSASDDGYFAYGDCNGSITFTNISDGIINNDTAYKVTEKKEFFIEPSQISDTKTDGNYSITFSATNLRLISAEVTNRPYAKVTPTVTKQEDGNVFTLNAKVPFSVPVYVSGSGAKVTYTTAESGSSAYELFSHNHSFQVTPGKVQYKKSFDDNGNAVYTVTLTPTNVTFGTPQIGTVESQKASVSGLSLDSSSTNLSGSLSNDGVTFNYSMTKPSDTTGTATVSNGTITCPIGSVLHVKAVPNGSVTFYNPNDLGETDINGATIASGVTVTSGQPITVNGTTTFTFPAGYFRVITLSDQTNSGSTYVYSTEKLKYSLQNANILYVTLRNQKLAMIGPRNGCFVPYKDPSIQQSCNCTKVTNNWSTIKKGNTLAYKIVNPWFKNIRVIARIRDNYLSNKAAINYYASDETTVTYRATSTDVFTFNVNGVVRASDGEYLSISGGTNSNSIARLYSTFPENLDTCIMNMSNTSDTSTGLWVTDGNLINFEGQGDLEVIVGIDQPSTITFNCENEDQTVHELYKENNFCLEPSQMTDNGDGTQSVTFTTTGSVTVTATYEIKQQTQVTVTKPSNVSFATINITGHKKEMEWTVCSASISTSTAYGSAQKIRFDGTRCYCGSVDGEIWKSDDLGKTWASLGNTKPISSEAMFFIGPSGLYYTEYSTGITYLSTDEGKTWTNIKGINRSGYWFDVLYSFNANLTARAVTVSNEVILKSTDCKTWSNATNLSSSYLTSYFGLAHFNGTWINRAYQESSATLFKSSNNCSSWSSTSLPTASESYFMYGSNIMLMTTSKGEVYTCTNPNLTKFVKHNVSYPYGDNECGGTCYANGNFVMQTRLPLKFAYTTFHDGVMWRLNSNTSIKEQIGVSRDIDDNISAVIDTEANSNTVYGTNFTVTDISVNYYKLIPLNPSTVIEYKKIRLPENSAYIDYSTNPCTPYFTETYSSFYTAEDAWYYDEKEGFAVNKAIHAYYASFPLSFPGDHSSLYYTDDWFRMSQYSADGWTQYSDKKVKEYYTAGLTRTHTPFDSFVLGKGVNWNEYHDIQGKLSYIIQTVTLPINAALWSGARGSSLHNYTWQSNGSGDWNNRDATTAVKEVTKSACAKLKTDYGSNLRVYIIKYRKQDKYLHKVTNAETSFDYSYLNNCATGTSSPYMYDITTESELKSALEAIYTNIKDWAGRTEAKNV